MRRELSLVGASIVVYACALVLGTLVICGTGHASEVVGQWATQGNAAHVRIERCSTAPKLLCGLVTWLWEPIDAEGEPVRDKHNPDPRLRARTVVGVPAPESDRDQREDIQDVPPSRVPFRNESRHADSRPRCGTWP